MIRAIQRVVLIASILSAAYLPASAQGREHRAGLVVRFGDGRVETRCVAFAEQAITSEELLARSGLKAIVNPMASLGGAVCSIEGYGCSYPAQDCFCKCVGVQCEYWAYYHWLEGAQGVGGTEAGAGPGWQYSQIGASAYQATDGALEGWSWGPGNFSSGTEPPKIAFADVCPAGAVRPPAPGGQASGPGNPAQYLGFALLALFLLGAAALVVRRTRTTVGLYG